MAYDRLFADIYDRFSDPSDYLSRAKYHLQLLRSYGISSGLLLDAACGTGTLTRFYLEAGYDVIAADVSADMLLRAQEKLSIYKNRVLFICQRLEELDLYGTVRAAVCSLDSLNHLLTVESLLETLKRICLFTEPGGVFLFDMNSVYKHRVVLGNNTFVFEDDDTFLVWQNELEEETDTVNMAFDIFTREPDGSYLRTQDENTERAYSVETVNRLALQAGFRNVKVFADLSTQPPGNCEERLCFIAEK